MLDIWEISGLFLALLTQLQPYNMALTQKAVTLSHGKVALKPLNPSPPSWKFLWDFLFHTSLVFVNQNLR